MLTIKNRAGKNLVFFLTLATFFAGCRPHGPQALLDGKELLEHGHYGQAIEKLQVATSLIGTNAHAWNYLGLAYHYANQATNAAQAYQNALNRDHDLTEAHYNLGCLWLEQNRLEAAKAELTAYTLRRDKSAGGWVKLGTAQFRSRDWAAAEKSFKEALQISPQNPEALNGMGLLFVQRNRASDAAQVFGDVLKQHPDYSPALLNLAVVSQQHLNRRPFALQKYQEYLALPGRPANWAEVNATAQALEQELTPVARPAPVNPAPPPAARISESKPASNTVTRVAAVSKPEPPPSAVKTAPTNHVAEPVRLPPEPVVRPAQAVSSASGSNVTPEAGTDRTSAVSRIGTSPTGMAPSVEAAAASNAYQRYRYRSPASPVAGNRSAAERLYTQAVHAQRSGRFAEAIQGYRDAVQSDPAYFEAYYNLGLAATSVTNLPQALAAYETALTIRSESIDTRYNFALVLKQAGYVIDSVNELERLSAAYPNESRAHLALGNLYAYELRQAARAREHYVKVLQTDPQNAQAGAIRDWLVANSR